MKEEQKIKARQLISELKLNALLEVTKAINNNFSTSQLLDLYQTILENKLGVKRLALFNFDQEWRCILKYGIPIEQKFSFEEELLTINEIESITFGHSNLSKLFEIVIPVYHKKTPLAFVLLGDIDNLNLELSTTIKHLPYIQTLTNVIVVAIENKKLFKENIKKAQISTELELAQNIQKMLFPKHLPETSNLNVHAVYIPHQMVSGDYYDFIQLNNHEFAFCVADVSGKGVAAALVMSNIQATLHSLLNYTHNLKDIIIELNSRVFSNAGGEKFVSMFLGKLNIKSQQLTYINAGHCNPIMYYQNKFTELDKGCTLLGISDNLNNNIEVEIFSYISEFTLFCYTDGLTDTLNSLGESFDIEQVKLILTQELKNSAKKINETIIAKSEEFKADCEYTDDIALLTLKVTDLEF
ncbi:MAG: PP2C family protein-serine/threonine phosphatase [Bacteroidetes bacterium]|nr:PP2C family protein-serine/threonine phosphatase [Bacteroidota bacterium]